MRRLPPEVTPTGTLLPVTALFRPSVGCLLGTVMLFGYGGKRLSPRAALVAVISTGSATLDVGVITAAAGLFIGALNITGLSFSLTLQLLSSSGNNLYVLLGVTAMEIGRAHV